MTAVEFKTATDLEVTAEVDKLLTTACNYNQGSKPVATLTVDAAQITSNAADGMLKFPLPGVTVRKVDGVGVLTVVAGPPEGKAIVVTADAGFTLTRATGNPLPADQLTKLARAIAA